jgi:PPK2 family polyphosphate:nucleotide phosphotransferase
LLIILRGSTQRERTAPSKRDGRSAQPKDASFIRSKGADGQELDHDYLWGAAARLPPRGDIGIFNRSYYEEVLVVRVHDDMLEKQRLPAKLVTKRIWKERFRDINAFERHLVRNGTVIIKFHLRISKEEQKRRLLARLDEPAKRWKFSMADLAERKLWDQYMDAYEDMICNTSTAEAPWYVLPADSKWFARLVMSTVIIDVLDRLDLEFPKFDRPALRTMKRMRKTLRAE